jgi:hypothetical protein
MVLFRWGHGGLHAFSQAVPHGAVLPTLRKDISQTVLLTPQKNGSDPFHDPQAAAPRAGPSAGKDGSMSFASREKAIFSQCEVGPPQPPLAWSSTPKRTCCVTPAATGTTRSGLALPSVDHQDRRLHGAGAEPVQGLLAGVIGSQGTGVTMRSYRH